MAREFRKKEDLFIKEKKRSKNFFITGSNVSGEVTKTTISSSVFNKMSQSFAQGDYLLDSGIREQNGAVLYMLQEMQADIDDLYNEASASSFESSFFPAARIDSSSFGVISSSLVPDKDGKYDLGSSGKEWNDLYVDGTAYIDSLDLNGTNINTTLNAKALKTHISGAFTSLSASIATDINNAGGGSTDFTSVDSVLAPDADNTRDLGYSNREWRNLYLDGTAYIDSIAGGTLTLPLTPPSVTHTSLKSSAVNVTAVNVLILNSSNALSIQTLTPRSVGQELTIMNIGSGAVTITRSTKNQARTIYGSSNITINQHQAYKFVCNPNQVWYQIS